MTGKRIGLGLASAGALALAAGIATPGFAQDAIQAVAQAVGHVVVDGKSRPPIDPRDAARFPNGDARRAGVMTLLVDATKPETGVISVTQTIPVVERGGEMVLRLPQWLPGNHAPRGSIETIAGVRFESGGRTLSWTRDPRDVFAYRIALPQNARSVTARFDALTPTRSAEGRVVMTPAMSNIQWEKLSLYPAHYATRNIRVTPSVLLPAGWTGYTALDGARRGSGTNRLDYAETDYETLVDSPMFAGQHAKMWDLGNDVRLAVVADDAANIAAATDAHINMHRALVSEALALFGSKHFDRYTFLLALTDEMGGIGLEHQRSSENSLAPETFSEWDRRASQRGLLPHEMIHSWNGKFRRPVGLWTPDYSVPMEGNLLWVYEGQTSFWDIVLGARSGLQSKEYALGEWARYAATYQNQPGRAWRSVEDTTFEPVISARRPRAWASYSRGEDYYNESSLQWLDVDQQIRRLTGGQRGLDDFAKLFFGIRNGDWGTVTYDFDEVVRTLNAVAPYDWSTFLTQRFRTPGAPAPLGGIEAGGYRLVYRAEPNAFDAERMRLGTNLDLLFGPGMSIDRDGTISSVQFDSPAMRSGLTATNKIVAVNGRSYSADRMKAAVTAATDRNRPVELIVQRGDRVRTVRLDYTGGLRYPHLEKVGTGPSGIDLLLEPRRAAR